MRKVRPTGAANVCNPCRKGADLDTDPRFHIEAAERALNNILRGLSN